MNKLGAVEISDTCDSQFLTLFSPTDFVQHVAYPVCGFTVTHLTSISCQYSQGYYLDYLVLIVIHHRSCYSVSNSGNPLTTVQLVLPHLAVCALLSVMFLCVGVINLCCQTVLLLLCSCLKCKLTTVAVKISL